MRAPHAVRREPAGDTEQAAKWAIYILNKKRNIF